MGASIVSCCDASPVLDPAEHVFDAVSLLVERFVVFGGMLALFARRDSRGNAFIFQTVAEPVGIVAATGQQLPGFWQTVETTDVAIPVNAISVA